MKRNHHSRTIRRAAAIVLAGLATASLFGQMATSGISGTVQDPTAATIPGADVVISNPLLGIERKLRTNSAGLFSAPQLPPSSDYSVTVSKEGFSKYEVKDITLQVGQAMEINLAEFFPGGDSAQDLQTRKVLSELSKEEILLLIEIKKCSTTLSDDDKKLVLGMIRKMATIVPPPRNAKSVVVARGAQY